MQKLLTQYYGGSINKFEFVNYAPDKIVQTFHNQNDHLVKNHLDEFQSFIDYNNTSKHDSKDDLNEYVRQQMEFEEIMQVNSDYFSAPNSTRVQHNEKYMAALEREEILASTKLDEQRAAQYVRMRERELLGLEKAVVR